MKYSINTPKIYIILVSLAYPALIRYLLTEQGHNAAEKCTDPTPSHHRVSVNLYVY